MELRSSPSDLLRGILQSTLFLLEHYGRNIDHLDSRPVLHELRASLIRAICALGNASLEEIAGGIYKETEGRHAEGPILRK